MMSHDLVFDPDTVDIDAMLKRLNLANSRRVWQELAHKADTESWSARTFLATLAAEEIAHRQQTRITRTVRAARFPFLKTIEDFDFSLQKSLKRRLLTSYLTPDLVTEGRNLILLGRTGRGKTHIAIAIAYRAIQNGFTALFTTAAQLIEDLSVASRSGELRQTLATFVQPHVLIIDEVGYLTYGDDAANVLFHVVNERTLKARPMIFTTNKSPFTQWGDVLHDRDLAEAIVDRTLEKGLLLILDGPSYRTRHLPNLTLDTTQEPAIISGNDRTEFPEPALRYPDQIRKSLSTTNAVEAINGQLEISRLNSGGYFQSQGLAKAKLAIAITRLETKRWIRPPANLASALTELNLMFEARFETEASL